MRRGAVLVHVGSERMIEPVRHDSSFHDSSFQP